MTDAGIVESPDGTARIVPRGAWTVAAAAALDRRLAKLVAGRTGPAAIDLDAVDELDTAGAWLLVRTVRRIAGADAEIAVMGGSAGQRSILQTVAEAVCPVVPDPTPHHGLRALVERVGRAALHVLAAAREQIAFFGAILVRLAHLARRPRSLRGNALVDHIERTGLDAVPIVALLAFLIGVVMAYQGATQLQRFGAEIFTVDLIGVSVLRELGVLLTAIIVAGRSGSAFTAEIGSMVVNEEIDAARTMGIDPIDALVLPRLLALMITLPLLSFIANLAGLLGGGLVVMGGIGITLGHYLERLLGAVTLTTFLVGMVKAPVFAFLIAMVGCFHGLRVERTAQSVGRMTTRSVVVGIFLVIVADAAFSILFAKLGL